VLQGSRRARVAHVGLSRLLDTSEVCRTDPSQTLERQILDSYTRCQRLEDTFQIVAESPRRFAFRWKQQRAGWPCLSLGPQFGLQARRD